MAKKADRLLVTLACPDCKERTYHTEKNRRNDPDRLELQKFCPRCRKHTAHRETRYGKERRCQAKENVSERAVLRERFPQLRMWARRPASFH